eukprot:sb/3466106/
MSRTLLNAANTGYTGLTKIKGQLDKVIQSSGKSKEDTIKEYKKVMEWVTMVLDRDLPAIQRVLQGSEGIAKLQKENADLTGEVSVLTAQNADLWKVNEKLTDYSKVTDKVQEMLTEFKRDLPDPAQSQVDVTMKKEIKDAVKDNLKEVMTEAVNKIVNTDKMKKTFAEVVNNSQNIIKKETKKCFDESLSSALQESQNEIVAKTTARQEDDQFEKERRVRNVTVVNIPESSLPESKDREEADAVFTSELLQIRRNQVIACYRAGPPIGTGSNKDKEGPRPLIVVLETPELAKSKHKYGNGDRIIVDGVIYWVNPDLTRAERKANWRAREKRKERFRRREGGGTAPESGNSANVVT